MYKLHDLDKEVFCLKFEQNALADLLIRKKAERWVHGFIDKLTEEQHLNRYNFVLDKVEGKNVLDIACGSGYGSYLIAKKGNANKVIGVDLDEDAIVYGNYRYPHVNIERIKSDATTYRNSEKFDVIVSFETIEHIPDYEKYVKNLFENLTNDGVLYISTPITKQTTASPANPFHVIEWSFQDFHNLFKKFFIIKEIYLQDVSVELIEWKVPNLFQKI